jgi:hypothetical protein
MNKSQVTSGPIEYGVPIVGGGIGTLAVLLATSLPEGSAIKSILIFLSPTITIIAAGAGQFIKAVYVDPYYKRKKYKAELAVYNEMFDDAMEHSRKLDGDPSAPSGAKKTARRNIDEIERIRTEVIRKNLDASLDNEQHK